MDEIEVPEQLLSDGDLVEEAFGQQIRTNNYAEMFKRAILTPFNREAAKINDQVIARLAFFTFLHPKPLF